MKFYAIRIQNKVDGTEVRNITPCETQTEAEIQFHKFLAADMGKEDMESVTCSVLGQNGELIFSRYWKEPAISEASITTE